MLASPTFGGSEGLAPSGVFAGIRLNSITAIYSGNREEARRSEPIFYIIDIALHSKIRNVKIGARIKAKRKTPPSTSAQKSSFSRLVISSASIYTIASVSNHARKFFHIFAGISC
jgi:hypothetical protein